jgi:hypothetical protein
VRRRSELGVLHQVVRENLETFLAEARARGDGAGIPAFIERELRDYLSCGVLARGFARFRCDCCGHEVLVAFSCKSRGLCPSCCGRRMAALAAPVRTRRPAKRLEIELTVPLSAPYKGRAGRAERSGCRML